MVLKPDTPTGENKNTEDTDFLKSIWLNFGKSQDHSYLRIMSITSSIAIFLCKSMLTWGTIEMVTLETELNKSLQNLKN